MAEAGAPAQIPLFFAGRSVLITGATGFMGKVLVERLLATCPAVGSLHLLVRNKRDADPERRLKDLKQSPVFDVLRHNDPGQLNKLRIVAGNISQPGLDLSQESLERLAEVSVVFNIAATVRFCEPLRTAVQLNSLSVQRVMELADRLEHVAAFVHLSTGYSHPELGLIEERVYPLPRPLPLVIQEALAVPDDAPAAEVDRFIAPKPNTYTFAKALGESAARAHGCDRYPVAILKPTIVTSSLRHPFPGWLETLSGVQGVLVSVGTGLMRVFRCRGSAHADLMPVDLAIDALIAAVWETAVDRPRAVRVYNCSTCNNPVTWGRVRDIALRSQRARPWTDARGWPIMLLISNRLLFNLLTFMLQTLPLYCAEYVRRIVRHDRKNNPDLIQVAQRLKSMSNMLGLFACNEWTFVTDNLQRLQRRLTPADAHIYNFDPNTIHWDTYLEDFTMGMRRHLKHDKDETIPHAQRRMRRIYYIQNSLLIVLPLLIIQFLFGSPALALEWFAHLVSLSYVMLAEACVSLAQLPGEVVA